MIEINLLPGAQRKAKRGAGGFDAGALLSGIGAPFKDKYMLGGLVGALVGVLAVAGMYVYQDRQATALDERAAAASRDSARYSAVLVARSRAEASRDSVYQQLAIIKSIDDTRYTWPHILEAIAVALPPYTWLTGVTQTSAVTTTAADNDTTAKGQSGSAKPDSGKKKGDARAEARRQRAHADSLYNGSAAATKFRVVGQTVDIQALTLFMKNLEASPFIRNVQLTRSDLVMANNREVTEFQLEAETEPPTPGVLHTVPLSIAVH